MRELKTEHKRIEGTVPYRPFIIINRQRNVKLFGYPVRPRTIGLGLLILCAMGCGLIHLIGSAK
jgi:hypothetical protein